MKLLLTHNKYVYKKSKKDVALFDNNIIKFKNSFGNECLCEKKLVHTSHIHELNVVELEAGFLNQLWYSVYNRLAVNQLSYISFYIITLNQIILENKYQILDFNELIPKNFCFPIAFALGDTSKSIRWSSTAYNLFLYEAFNKQIKVKGKFRRNISNVFRKYLIFGFKFLLSIFFSTLASSKSIGKKILIIRDKRTIEYIDGKEFDTFILIPSYRIVKDFARLKGVGSLVSCYKPWLTLKQLVKNQSNIGDVQITENLSISKSILLKAYMFEEFDKLSVFIGLQSLQVDSDVTVVTPDFSSEYAYFQRIAFSKVYLKFHQTYALSVDRIKYFPTFNEMLLDDRVVEDSLATLKTEGILTKVKDVTFSKINKIEKLECIGVVTQPNFNLDEGLSDILSALKEYGEGNGVKLVVKVHPRDTSDYSLYSRFLVEESVSEFIDQCDVLVGKSSYMLYEALKRGRMYFNMALSLPTSLSYLNNIETTFNTTDELIDKLNNLNLYVDFFIELQLKTFR